VARLHDVTLQTTGGQPIALDRILYSVENVPPGEETRIGVAVPHTDAPRFEEGVRDPSLADRLELSVEYTDLSCVQRQRSTIALVKRPPDSGWRALFVDHQFLPS
jgi:hypothetical protein